MVAQRTITNQLYRYEELLALHLTDEKRASPTLSRARPRARSRCGGRRNQLRFRRDPQAYLASLEQRLFRSGLPS